MREFKILLGGNWEEGQERRTLRYPYDDREIAEVHIAGVSQAEKALDMAEAAFDAMRRLSSEERFNILAKVSSRLKELEQEIAREITLACGKPIKDATTEVKRAQFTFLTAAEEAKRIGGEIYPLDMRKGAEKRWAIVRRFPIGIIFGIAPFNFPLNLVAHKLAPAIASGNSIIIRPATQTATVALRLGQILYEAGLPEGALSVLPSTYEAADRIIGDPRVKLLTFTGSAQVGWGLKKKAAKKKVVLELGGNAASIVEPDVPLEWSVERNVLGAYNYSGQVCISVQRIYVHQSIYREFLDRFVERVKTLKIGDPLDPEVRVGPLINDAAVEKTLSWVEEAKKMGGKVLMGGERKGRIITPMVIVDVPHEAKVVSEEAFAPLVVIMPYEKFEEAVERVNDSKYGLQAGVFTKDLLKIRYAYENIEVGGVVVNDAPSFRVDHMIYGGVKESGFGREGLRYAIEEMTEPRLLVLNTKF